MSALSYIFDFIGMRTTELFRSCESQAIINNNQESLVNIISMVFTET